MHSSSLRAARIPARLLSLCIALCALVTTGAADAAQSTTAAGLRLWRNPYGQVNWKSDVALLGQHHDHVGAEGKGLSDYDRAGYQVMSLMTYSGVPEYSYTLNY